MAAKRRDALKKLLAKGRLSGLETAKLALAECWEGEHARDSILSELERQGIRDRLTNPNDIRDYNNWIGAFPTICAINYIAHIMFLILQQTLSNLEMILRGYIAAAIIELQIRMRPKIVTVKQLEDVTKEHKKSFFKERYTLEWILYERAEQLATKEGVSLDDLLEEENAARAAHFYRLACLEIRQLIECGNLKLSHGKKVPALLRAIETAKPDRELLAIIESTLSTEPMHKIEEPEPLLEKACVTGKSLYDTGLPEWVDWEKHYGHGGQNGLAVVQNPKEEDLDSKGHYRDEWKLIDNCFLRKPDESFQKATGLCPQEFFAITLDRAKMDASHFLFCKAVLQELAEILAIPFTEDVDSMYRSLNSSLASIENTLRWASDLDTEAKSAFAGMRVVDLEELQTSPQVRALIRNRLLEPLKKDEWFQDCKEYHLKERLSQVPKAELDVMLSGIGREARKKIYTLMAKVTVRSERNGGPL